MLVSNNLPVCMPVEMVSTKWGWMLCPKGDKYVTGSLKRWGVYSETEIMLLQTLCANKAVLVIGGNIGALAVPVGLASCYLEVYEPQPLICKLLEANVNMCNADRVYVEHGAVGAEAGVINVPMVDFGADCNMGMIGKEHWGSGQEVKLFDINKVLTAKFDFMVVDAEGMELEILSAARRELLPAQMWVECDRPDTGPALIEKIEELGYEAYWMINPLTPNGVDPGDSEWPLQASFNLLCLRVGAAWPFEGINAWRATAKDNIGSCLAERMIWSLEVVSK